MKASDIITWLCGKVRKEQEQPNFPPKDGCLSCYYYDAAERYCGLPGSEQYISKSMSEWGCEQGAFPPWFKDPDEKIPYTPEGEPIGEEWKLM